MSEGHMQPRIGTRLLAGVEFKGILELGYNSWVLRWDEELAVDQTTQNLNKYCS